MAIVVIGQSIPMALKLYDNAADKKVKATVYSQFGDSLFSAYLYHVQDGLYMNTEILMPDIQSIVVTYSVENSDQYVDTAEQFFSAPKVQDDEKYLTGLVKSVENRSEIKTGTVYEIKGIEPIR